MQISFSESSGLLKVHVVGHFMELFRDLLDPVFGKNMNKNLVEFEVEGVLIKAKPTRSYDFTVVEVDGDFEPHINTKQGSKRYYTIGSLSFRLGSLYVTVS